MKIGDAVKIITNLENAVCGLQGAFRLNVSMPEEPIKKWLTNWPMTLHGAQSVSAPEVRSAFGVYVIATYPEGDVIYVGKATPGARNDTSDRTIDHHLTGEMLVRVGRPPSVAIPGIMFHKGSLLAAPRMTETAKSRVQKGDLTIALLMIEPWQFSSYVETYLRAAIHVHDGILPLANERIG
ncbi:hypothetical protein EV700_3118 [Fluviicoccus keumensis]|uniref:Uncharacterized protein n=1 Tax=Fluviicoccus keumensis TaxID=1435465 RepID=A0A4Q7YK85_9GAMM|nr:hypothetical protein [Fluviicoccus keumensis]RZU36905.1 hypothetical protein EV700_3118 [Fluviicoccus keumensis]